MNTFSYMAYTYIYSVRNRTTFCSCTLSTRCVPLRVCMSSFFEVFAFNFVLTIHHNIGHGMIPQCLLNPLEAVCYIKNGSPIFRRQKGQH